MANSYNGDLCFFDTAGTNTTTTNWLSGPFTLGSMIVQNVSATTTAVATVTLINATLTGSTDGAGGRTTVTHVITSVVVGPSNTVEVDLRGKAAESLYVTGVSSVTAMVYLSLL